jgi:deoxyribodipyrimidine photo-lyase
LPPDERAAFCINTLKDLNKLQQSLYNPDWRSLDAVQLIKKGAHMTRTNIWWIRRDFRLHDNPSLTAAVKDAASLIPLFIIEPALMQTAAPKRKAFLVNALADLDRKLREKGSQLIVREGPASQAFHQLAEEQDNPFSIFAHEDFSPFSRQRDQAVSKDHALTLCPGVVLRHPESILKDDGDPYIVYTPYKTKWYQQHPLPTPADCIPAPESLPQLPKGIHSIPLRETPPPPDQFPAKAAEALRRLTEFTQSDIRQYQSRRDRLDLDGTSRLSPYLRFGLVSAREAFAQAQIAFLQASDSESRQEIRTWMDELVWREFYTAILYHFPGVTDGPFREAYSRLRWRQAPEDLKAWQEGQTGYPVVDACMRQLKETGWMHNRGRMIAASFLTKDLLINWQEGEAWFMAHLVDGDPAANNGGWQWAAGTGTDAAPYFRIFNPVLQGQKHDPDGKYIARWVPELAKLPPKFRHEPWKMSASDSRKYDFTPGEDYPFRIVDHKFARQRTLDAYKQARETHQEEAA